jgi:hypothetical protein
METFMRTVLAASAVSVMIALAATYPEAAGSTEFVYVESNIQSANGNSIFAFQRNLDGSLSPLAGSPFPSGGAGVQYTGFVFGPYDSDQNLVVDPGRRQLFAVNSGSDTIAVFNINSDGSLTAIPGSPFPSGGTNPVSLGLAGGLLFVVNKNGDFARLSSLQPNYTDFRIASDGSLSPVSDSTIDVAFTSSPAQALVARDHLLFGADFAGGLLESFTFDDDGHLHQNLPIALPAEPGLPGRSTSTARLTSLAIYLSDYGPIRGCRCFMLGSPRSTDSASIRLTIRVGSGLCGLSQTHPSRFAGCGRTAAEPASTPAITELSGTPSTTLFPRSRSTI